MRNNEILRSDEWQWLTNNDINYKNRVIPEALWEKAIMFNVFGDTYSDNIEKGVNFVLKNFNDANKTWKQYFDLVSYNENYNRYYFFIFIDSKDENNLNNELTRRLIHLIQFIGDIENTDNEIDMNNLVENFNIAKILQDMHDDSESTKEIIIYDVNNDTNFLNKLIDDVLSRVAYDNSDITITPLSYQKYKNRLIDELYDDKDLNKSNKNKFIFSYDDPNPGVTEEGSNRNFIKYKSLDHMNYIFSLNARNLVSAYIQYGTGRGNILEKNVRYSISNNKSVDTDVMHTIQEEPGNFWVLNNGMTIVAEKISIDEFKKEIELQNFNIINGAQTITTLWKSSSKKNVKDNLSLIYLPVKIIILKDIDKEDKEILKIVKSANNQKPIQPRDLVANNKEMISLKEYFKTKNVILNIKRGDEKYKDKDDSKEIKSKYNLDKVDSVKNSTLGQFVIALILQSPGKSLQVKNKIFNKDNYDKVFNNSKINDENIYLSYKFAIFMDEIMTSLSEDNEINFYLYANTNTNEGGDNDALKNIENLFQQTKIWFISFIYYAIFLNQNNRDLINLAVPTKTQFDQLEKIFPRSNEYLINDEQLLTVPQTTTSALRNSINKLVNKSIKVLSDLWREDKEKRIQKFSFSQAIYRSYVANMISMFDNEILSFLSEFFY